jgi:hypothetical protein
MKAFKDWGYNLAPKLQFDYFMEKVQKLGKDNLVQEELHKLRLFHKKELGYDRNAKAFVNRPVESESEECAGADCGAAPGVGVQRWGGCGASHGRAGDGGRPGVSDQEEGQDE